MRDRSRRNATGTNATPRDTTERDATGFDETQPTLGRRNQRNSTDWAAGTRCDRNWDAWLPAVSTWAERNILKNAICLGDVFGAVRRGTWITACFLPFDHRVRFVFREQG